MSIISWALKASRTFPGLVASLFGSPEIPPPKDTKAYLGLYKTDPWIYTPVWIIASTAAKAPRRIKRTDSDGKATFIIEHPLLDLLDRPNEDESAFDFFEATYANGELTGEMIWEIVPQKGFETPAELYNLRADRVTVVASDDRRKISGYEWRAQDGDEPENFEPEQIMRVVYYNPNDDWRGLSSVAPLADDIVAGKYATRWIRRFLRRYGVPDGALEADQPINSATIKRIEEKWRKKWSEAEDTTPVMVNGLKFAPYGQPPKGSGMLDLIRYIREAKLAAMGVPPVLAGLLEYAKYANYDLQLRAFFLITIAPKLLRLEAAINRSLMPHYPSPEGFKDEFEFDKRVMGFVDIKMLIEVLTDQFDMAGLTPDEVISLTGLGNQYSDGEKHYIGERRLPVEGAPAVEGEPEFDPNNPVDNSLQNLEQEAGLGDQLEPEAEREMPST